MSKRVVCILLLAVCSWQAHASTTFRRVVPPEAPADNVDTFHTLNQALTTAPALAANAVIQIEPGARPATVTNGLLSTALGLASFTLRGNLAFDASEFSPITIADAVTVTGTGVRLENLNLLIGASGSLTVNGPGFTFANNLVTEQSTTGGLRLNSTGAVVSSNRFRHGASGGSGLLRVQGASGSVIEDNQFIGGSGAPVLLNYETAGTKNDVVQRNFFRGSVGNSTTTQLALNNGVTNVTVRQNVFTDSDFHQQAIAGVAGVQNIVIEANRFEFPQLGTLAVVAFSGGTPGLTTSVTVRGNDFNAPFETGLSIGLVSTGSASAVVEGNRFRSLVGISLFSTGISMADIDLGGGTQGSLGKNDFSAFTAAATSTSGAIVAQPSATSNTIAAANNAFAGNPEAAIFDQGDDGTRFDIDSSDAVTGNTAFVAALFSRFLGSPTSTALDAAALSTQLDEGAKRATVAKTIIRSDEALTLLIQERYRAILLRPPDTDELAAALKSLKRSGKDEDLITLLFAHPEGNQIRGSARAFVADLFAQLLQRTPTDAEYLAVGKQASRSRSLAVKAVLTSTEYKTQRVTQVFNDLLRRVPTEAENKKFLAIKRLDLQTAVVTLPDFAGGN